ncbi:DUF2797 domain-containing protein [Colwellia sp. 4_MG-2023]|uniref:DUF2797 domain-containing protein n=1 Tax=unclassified Colwellia TaxID=196834 RepID=UPI001C0A442B|nr:MULTISPECIES: DUF2797 domain-containing protein [unclassified Colwellia]MBU2925037.1 DUF2797 domain-containing protein [Colwellia sp. C2M11]MDO6486442.1 DUF2797 domain-containing protein [Colwellia sp. 6_MG-2023]MDO6506320.1 DUF2797 domain-containing protein [Colwellia sp. 5_MG-2023]MDO6555144.1 DUF2797 domain-containing protein [Colwellia sp. 4_MG-2023]MDO6651670.1 DUF2797 domain-containing protein [Colwellia sp. 3_MG-2023]
MPISAIGAVEKMTAKLDSNNIVQYKLPLAAIDENGEQQSIALNPLIGRKLTLVFHSTIACKNCGTTTKKSYSQGFCYPCMTKLAQCDMCIMKPETCHYHLGTCREPEWAEQHCMVDHYVYLSNTSGLKVGITRHTQIPTRWIDQGATQALPLFKVRTRLQSGLIETALSELVSDKTNWRAMLKGSNEPIDLKAQAKVLIPQIADRLSEIKLKYGEDAVQLLNEEVVDIVFPVSQYLTKISSFNFDKTSTVSGILLGIKGQYLIFEEGVINMRKFSSYQISAEY